MSRKSERSLSGPGTIVGSSPSFAERLRMVGYIVPDQEHMLQMMRATAVGLAWSATLDEIVGTEAQARFIESFTIYNLDDYEKLPNLEMGAPMPGSVKEHIREVKGLFRGAEARIHAHPKDDPFVEFIFDGQSVFTKAWKRNMYMVEIYPKG